MAKKMVVVIVLAAFGAVVLAGNVSAQEMQLSGGMEFGFGVSRVNNDFAFYDTGDVYHYNENYKSLFFAPGLSLSLRYFPDTESTLGFFFRDRSIFITNAKITGTGSITNGSITISEKISETYSAADGFMGIMDFDFGPSFRFILSEKLQLCTDLGVNFTIMDTEDDESGETLNYWGIGIFSAVALQLNIGKIMYLEFGLNTIMNIVSSQKGKIYDPMYVAYEDTGRFDLISMAPYIHIGWRLDVKKVRSGLSGKQFIESAYAGTP